MIMNIVGWVLLAIMTLNIVQMIAFAIIVGIDRREGRMTDEGREAAYWAALDKKLKRRGGGVL